MNLLQRFLWCSAPNIWRMWLSGYQWSPRPCAGPELDHKCQTILVWAQSSQWSLHGEPLYHGCSLGTGLPFTFQTQHPTWKNLIISSVVPNTGKPLLGRRCQAVPDLSSQNHNISVLPAINSVLPTPASSFFPLHLLKADNFSAVLTPS